MRQRGWKPGGSALIDDLTYAYNSSNNSNKLLAVTESSSLGSTDNKLGDFTDKNTSLDDYSYDDNGNLTADKNKHITAITYNYLNLPQQISVNKDDGTAKGTITYTYDAAGIKLQKTVNDIAGAVTNTTLYIAGFEYKNDTLQQVAMEEGRVRYAKKYFLNGDSTYDYFYDYFLKDHLGNVRMVLTGQIDTAGYYATMEPGTNNATRNKENALFSHIDESAYATANISGGYPTDNSATTPNDYVAGLNGSGQKIGPSIVLKVMSGDIIDLAVKSYYKSQTTGGDNSDILTDILTSLAGGIVSVAGESHGSTSLLSNSSSSPLLGALDMFLSNNNPDVTGKPKAYLNWILLDERFNYVNAYPQSGALPVGDADALQTLAYSGINITKSGYLYIYVSNETQGWDVFFDNLSIKHYTGPILEETHYYPFGLTMAGISSKALNFGAPENKKKYNGIEKEDGLGIEIYDAQLRELDPQIGRWWQIDPKVENMEMWSPYASNYDNPIRYSDPLGDEGQDCCWDEIKAVGNFVGGAVVGAVVGTVDNMTGTNFRGKMSSAFEGTGAAGYGWNLGLDVADAGGVVIGTIETTAGGAGMLGGTLTTVATGGSSAPVTVPVTMGSAALATHGVLTMSNSANNLVNRNGRVNASSSNPPNPNGKKGGQAHQDKVNEVEADMKKRGMTTDREVKVKTPGGNKQSRYIDVEGTNPKTGAKEQVQVGKKNKNGTPVSRERKAMNDVQNATGNRPKFVPYN